MTTLVVSPHLDDAVLSAGLFLLTEPGAVVATVMAGHPGPGVLSDWDRACGFVDGDDPVARRRDEDRAALAILGARPHHLEFLDQPYRAGRAADEGGSVDAGRRRRPAGRAGARRATSAAPHPARPAPPRPRPDPPGGRPPAPPHAGRDMGVPGPSLRLCPPRPGGDAAGRPRAPGGARHPRARRRSAEPPSASSRRSPATRPRWTRSGTTSATTPGSAPWGRGANASGD